MPSGVSWMVCPDGNGPGTWLSCLLLATASSHTCMCKSASVTLWYAETTALQFCGELFQGGLGPVIACQELCQDDRGKRRRCKVDLNGVDCGAVPGLRCCLMVQAVVCSGHRGPPACLPIPISSADLYSRWWSAIPPRFSDTLS
jgi:hypothetical protein